MIRYLKHSEIDPEKWNQTVRNSLFSTVFAEYEMLDLLTGDGTWDALVLRHYEAVMPLPFRKKGVLKYVYTPFFMPQMGIFSDYELTGSEIDRFMNEVANRYVLSDVLLNKMETAQNIYDDYYVSYFLDLQSPYNELFSNFHENTKRNIKAGEKGLCQVTVGEEQIGDIIDLFRHNRGHEEAVHYQEQDYEILEIVANILSNRGLLEIYGIRTPEGKLAAGALFVKDGIRRWFWFSGRDNEQSRYKPMFLLLNNYIRDHAGTGIHLDFNGSKNPNVARLYKGFGGIIYCIPFVRRYKNTFWRFVLKLIGK